MRGGRLQMVPGDFVVIHAADEADLHPQVVVRSFAQDACADGLKDLRERIRNFVWSNCHANF